MLSTISQVTHCALLSLYVLFFNSGIFIKSFFFSSSLVGGTSGCDTTADVVLEVVEEVAFAVVEGTLGDGVVVIGGAAGCSGAIGSRGSGGAPGLAPELL